MHSLRPPESKRARGFTLVELGVVMAVIAIMAGSVMVDVIEVFKNRAAQNDTENLYFIQQAAKDYFHGTVLNFDADQFKPAVEAYAAYWPGETTPGTCTTASKVQPGMTGDIMNALKNNGFLAQSFPTKNAWGNPYLVAISPAGVGAVPPAPGARYDCALIVATDVPAEVANVVSTYLPLGRCSGCAINVPGVPAGYKRCCSQIPKPGVEASILLAKDAYDWMVAWDKAHP